MFPKEVTYPLSFSSYIKIFILLPQSQNPIYVTGFLGSIHHNSQSSIEKLQHKFLKYVSFTLNIHCCPHNYHPTLHYLGLDTLANNRYLVNLFFLNKLLSGDINCFSLFSKIGSFLLYSIIFFFRLPYRATIYECNEPIYRMLFPTNFNPSSLVLWPSVTYYSIFGIYISPNQCYYLYL